MDVKRILRRIIPEVTFLSYLLNQKRVSDINHDSFLYHLFLCQAPQMDTNLPQNDNYFNFIQQKSPTSISGEMNVKLVSVQWGFEPRLNEVKASGGCHRF